jgi:hypothetical protein
MLQRSPCCVLMLNYPAQNLGRAFYHLGHVAGTGPGLIALHRGVDSFASWQSDTLIDVWIEGPYFVSQIQRTRPGSRP